MRTLIDQVEQSLASGQYLLSLYTTLTVPDIAGALSSENGEASGQKYAAWYEKWVRPRFFESVLELIPVEHRKHVKEIENPLTGEACYFFRCSLLHQGSTQHAKSPFSRIIFIEPGSTTNVVHYGQLMDALCIDLPSFCREVIAGGRLWLKQAENDALFVKNYERFVHRHTAGLRPYIVGVPVIG
jgi:hypothetical protein